MISLIGFWKSRKGNSVQMDNLTRDCVRAKALGYGCHYGKYKADHPQPTPNRKSIEVEEDDPPICPSCGMRFYPKRRGQIYCGTQCQQRRYYQKLKESKGESDPIKCPVCNKEFTPRWGMKYCSEACRSWQHNEIRRKRRKNGSK